MARTNTRGTLLLGGLGVGMMGLWMFTQRDEVGQLATSIAEEVVETVEAGVGWMERVISRVSQHEGRADSVNRNTDGAGLSFGILQWAQKPGALGVLLQRMADTDPERFITMFGPSWRSLLTTTAIGSLAAVDGAVLWQEPWVSRFIQAGREPVFVEVQHRLAAEGDHFKAALTAAEILGLKTERSVALMYDTAVQQGPGFARKLARKVNERYAGQTVAVSELLGTYARWAPAHFRRTTAPTEAYPVSHIAWKQVGPSEWHAWAGSFDLYTNVLTRRMGIVEDVGLSDAPIPTAGG